MTCFEHVGRDLNEKRCELRQLLNPTDLFRSLAPAEEADEKDTDGAQTHLDVEAQEPGYGSTIPAAADPSAAADAASQGGIMENTEHQQQSGAGNQDLALKNTIDAAYRGTGIG
ncbi:MULTISPECIES: hypothetical protein [Streptomyces]|uniref:hypothetical protein n=1 Tax=Streptomyces TaxID=1883 RepID=UPI00131E2030|nr:MULTISPECIES: hypothetical protein [Streptomyces]